MAFMQYSKNTGIQIAIRQGNPAEIVRNDSFAYQQFGNSSAETANNRMVLSNNNMSPSEVDHVLCFALEERGEIVGSDIHQPCAGFPGCPRDMWCDDAIRR